MKIIAGEGRQKFSWMKPGFPKKGDWDWREADRNIKGFADEKNTNTTAYTMEMSGGKVKREIWCEWEIIISPQNHLFNRR